MTEIEIFSKMSLVILIITVLGNVVLGAIGFLRSPAEKVNRLYFLLVLTYSTFLSTSYLTDVTHDPFWSPLILRINFVTGIFTTYSYVLFTSNFPKYRNFPTRIMLTILGVLTLIFAILAITTNLIMKEIILSEYGTGFLSGPLDLIFILIVISLLLIGIITLAKQYKISIGREKLQVAYLIIGSAIPAFIEIFIVIFPERLVTFGIATYDQLSITLLRQFGFSSSIIFTICTTYAMVKYRLLGIKILFGELLLWISTAIFMFTAFYSVALLELKYLDSLTSLPALTINVFLALVVGFVFNIYGKKLRQLIRRYIVNFSFDPIQVKEQFIHDISTLTDSDEILKHLTATAQRLFTTTKQGLLAAHISKGDQITTHWYNFSPEDVALLEQQDNMNTLLNHVHGKSAVFASQISQPDSGTTLTQTLNALDVNVVIPIQHNDLYMLYLLGGKSNNHAYTQEDLTLLEQLCYYTVLNLARTT